MLNYRKTFTTKKGKRIDLQVLHEAASQGGANYRITLRRDSWIIADFVFVETDYDAIEEETYPTSIFVKGIEFGIAEFRNKIIIAERSHADEIIKQLYSFL